MSPHRQSAPHTRPDRAGDIATAASSPTLLQPTPSRWTTAIAADILARAHLVRVLDRLNGRRGGIVLALHEISAEQLERQLEVVSETYSFVPLTELVDRLERSLPTRGLAAITFDDGPGSVTENAASVALRRGWPMTFFLPTGAIDRQQPAWYHELPALLLASSGHTFSTGRMTFRLNGSSSIGAALDALTAEFRALNHPSEVEHRLRAIRRALLQSDELDPSLHVLRPLTWERVRELSRHEELSFEAHTVTHMAMSRLSAADIHYEMTASRDKIREVTGRPVQHFCYPYGSAQDIGEVAPHIARRYFRSSVTMTRGRCTQTVDRARLPRVPLYEADQPHWVRAKIALAR